MKNILTVISITLILILSCDSSSSKDDKDDAQLNLTDKLEKKGSEIELPAYDGQNIVGKVVDSDDNGKGDGLDLSGDGSPEMQYDLSGTLSTKSESGTAVSFWFTGHTEVIYYLIESGDENLISADANLENATITFVVDSGLIQGLNSGSGDGVDIEVDVLSGIAPIFSDSTDGKLTVSVINGEDGSKLFFSVFDEGVEFTQEGEASLPMLAIGIVEVGAGGTGEFTAVDANDIMDTSGEEIVLTGGKRYIIASLLDKPPTDFNYITMEGTGPEDGYGQAIIGLNGNTTVVLCAISDFYYPSTQ